MISPQPDEKYGFVPEGPDAFLKHELGGLHGPMRLTKIGGGQSNPTFFVHFENRDLVLRKQPLGNVLPSAHAVDREYKVMMALKETAFRVPRMLLFHAGSEILGTPFYVMERIQGRVFNDNALPDV